MTHDALVSVARPADEIYDITILGGGPTGLFAAFYAGLRGASCKIVESLPALGGRLTAVYPEKYIYDVAGFPKVLARDLVENLVEQIKPYEPTVVLSESALELNKTPEGFFSLQTDKQQHLSRSILICAGVGSYKPKKHAAPTAEMFEGNGLEYAVIEKEKYRDKRVLIFGGGDSALDWANELVSIAQSVTLIHRSDKFRAHADSIKKLSKTSARVILNAEAIEFKGNAILESVVIQDSQTQEQTSLECDSAIILFGFMSSLGKLREWGLTIEDDCLLVNEKMETNIQGVYAAGDIVTYSSKLKLIVTGFSEAAIAVNFAKNFVDPKAKVQPMHSTTLSEIKERKAARGIS